MKSYPYTIENGRGERLTWTGVTRGPEGERLGADGVAQPGAGPPMRVHYLQEVCLDAEAQRRRVLLKALLCGFAAVRQDTPSQIERVARR